MILALSTLLGLALLAVLGLILEQRRISGLFESIYALLIAERDTAREENKALKAALFPQLARLNQPSPSKPESTPQTPKIDPIAGLFSSRIPTRLRLKKLTEHFNTQQRRTDSLAAAIKEKPSA